MATGGTLPTTRRQLISFYNTSGIIEKDKNMYFVPRFEKHSAVGQVKYAYKSIFETVCPPSSAYRDIEISTWSPEDRTLRVKGNVDDFRLITDEGACLNYFIVERTIITPSDDPDEEPVERIYLYAFFITGVRQAGGGSVEITCVPDDFTNVFYLHNTHQLTTQELQNGYEPFNERMKNCYVKRQHYNRVEEVGGHGGDIVTVNKDIFINQPQVFKYKYQYKDVRFPICPYADVSTFLASERQLIESNTSWANLSVGLKKRMIFASLSWIAIELKSLELLSYRYSITGTDPNTLWISKCNVGNGESEYLSRTNAVVVIPFMNVPPEFNYYKSHILATAFYLKANQSNATMYFPNAKEAFEKLNSNALSEYIYAIYTINDIGLNMTDIDFVEDDGDYEIHFLAKTVSPTMGPPSSGNTSATYGLGANINLVGILENPADIDHPDLSVGIAAVWANSSATTYSLRKDKVILGLGLGYQYKKRENYAFYLEDRYIPNSSPLINGYYDPVLESEPYSFHSISYDNYELPFPKNRYWSNYIETDSGVVRYNYYYSINGCVKLGFVPYYNVNNKKALYLNESLTFTSASSFPLCSDSYSVYYYQNMAQLKNQYAVNTMNNVTDLAQHLLISGPNAVGYSAGKAGISGKTGGQVGATALLETGNQVMQMIDELVDYGQSANQIYMNQKAVASDMGRRPDTLKQSGSDIFYDLTYAQNRLYHNHYTIDEVSYNSIAKLLERVGYQVDLYDTLHVVDRVGWNFVQLNGFDFDPSYDLMTSQEDTIRQIFSNGVTLLHDKTYLTSGHNYETILE